MEKRQFSRSEVGEVIQRIYDSEIHAKVEWLWDGGFETGIGCLGDFEAVSPTHRKIEEAVSELAFRIAKTHVGSAFTIWYVGPGWCATCDAYEDGCQCPMPELTVRGNHD